MPLTEKQKQKIKEEEEYRAKIKSDINPNSSGSRNKLIAALLALFLGDIGIHKFYLGKTMAGVISILFCWTFIPAIVGFFEGISYLSMSEEEFQTKYSNHK